MRIIISIICIILILASVLSGCNAIVEDLFGDFYEEKNTSDHEGTKIQMMNHFVSEPKSEDGLGKIGSFRLECSSAPANTIGDEEIYDGMTVKPGDYMIFLVSVEGASDNTVTVTSDDNVFIRTEPATAYTSVYVYFRNNGTVKLRLTSAETGESEILHIIVKGDDGRANKKPSEW